MNSFKKMLLCMIVMHHCTQAQDSVVFTRRWENTSLNFTTKQLIAPTLLLCSGLVSAGELKYHIANWRNNNLYSFYTDIDDPLSLSPLLCTYLMDACGMQPRTDFWNRSAILIKAELLMLATVYPLKWTTLELRPDGSDNRSFPSSHTAQAFLGATMLSIEYGNRYKWVPYFAYTTAGVVGILRMTNNKHYLPDVLVGAGIGILCQKISYWTHQYLWQKKCSKRLVRF